MKTNKPFYKRSRLERWLIEWRRSWISFIEFLAFYPPWWLAMFLFSLAGMMLLHPPLVRWLIDVFWRIVNG